MLFITVCKCNFFHFYRFVLSHPVSLTIKTLPQASAKRHLSIIDNVISLALQFIDLGIDKNAITSHNVRATSVTWTDGLMTFYVCRCCFCVALSFLLGVSVLNREAGKKASEPLEHKLYFVLWSIWMTSLFMSFLSLLLMVTLKRKLASNYLPLLCHWNVNWDARDTSKMKSSSNGPLHHFAHRYLPSSVP